MPIKGTYEPLTSAVGPVIRTNTTASERWTCYVRCFTHSP